MNSKGMSQTLALIVAASVLMMTALTVIFMVQGGLGDVNQDTSASSCQGTVNAICSGTNDPNMEPPATCLDNEGGGLVPGAENIRGLSAENLDCSQR